MRLRVHQPPPALRGTVLETLNHALFKLPNTHLLKHAAREKSRLGSEADIIGPGRGGRLLKRQRNTRLIT